MDEVSYQYITIDHPDTVAVFASPREGDQDNRTRVFYDLDSLFNTYAIRLMASYAEAELSGDETRKKVLAGKVMMLETIRQSTEALRMEADLDTLE